VPILVDPEGKSIDILKPDILIDAILAKVNLGTTKDMAGLTIALGPGFSAGEDVDFVIETKRGHNLGRIISKGTATPNTGIPGNIGGYTKERVIHALAAGTIRNIRKIGDVVQKGEPIAYIENGTEKINVNATITGIIRGLIRDGYPVTVGFKIADIDPRQEELSNCFTISDKARCIAGSVLELVTGYVDKKRGNTL
jgi:xanthine dehydrogenase accessory factor